MKTRVWVSFLLLTFIWGASFLWIKIAVLDIGPYALVAIRLLLGVMSLTVFMLVQRPSLPRDAATWRDLILLGVMNSALPWFFISWAEQSIDSAAATILNSTTPLFTIILANFLLRDDRMTRQRVAGLLLGFAGVVVLSRREAGVAASATTGSHWLGVGAMLAATFLYGASGVFARRRLRHVTPLVQAFYSMLVATVLMWLLVPAVGEAVRAPTKGVTWVALVWLGVLGAGVASYLFYYVLHAIGPTRASLVTYTIPIVGVTLGVTVLHERLDLYLILGTACIVSGVWVTRK